MSGIIVHTCVRHGSAYICQAWWCIHASVVRHMFQAGWCIHARHGKAWL